MNESGGRKKAFVNGTLIALNIIYFFYLEIAGSSEDTAFMMRHGAMYAPLVLEHGEYYRLLTSIFMHFGIRHLVNNMLVLFVVGDNLERALGRVKYLILYLFCGIGANVVSMFVGMKDYGRVVGAGASGAIFGVVGGLLVAVLKNQGRLEDFQSRQLVMMIVFSLYIGFTGSGVDNVAHVAGLVLGMLFALVFYRAPKRTRPNEGWNIME